jgi:hypothetical protein
MLMILRSLALLDKAFTTKPVSLPKMIQCPTSKINVRQLKGEKTTPSVTGLQTLKRKVGYNLNDTEERSEKRNKMVVDRPASKE